MHCFFPTTVQYVLICLPHLSKFLCKPSSSTVYAWKCQTSSCHSKMNMTQSTLHTVNAYIEVLVDSSPILCYWFMSRISWNWSTVFIFKAFVLTRDSSGWNATSLQTGWYSRKKFMWRWPGTTHRKWAQKKDVYFFSSAEFESSRSSLVQIRSSLVRMRSILDEWDLA